MKGEHQRNGECKMERVPCTLARSASEGKQGCLPRRIHIRSQVCHRFPSLALRAGVTGLLLSCLHALQPSLQAQLLPLRRPAAAPATTKPKDADAAAANDPAEQRFPGGAALKTDPEQQRLLKRAQQCVEDG